MEGRTDTLRQQRPRYAKHRTGKNIQDNFYILNDTVTYRQMLTLYANRPGHALLIIFTLIHYSHYSIYTTTEDIATLSVNKTVTYICYNIHTSRNSYNTCTIAQLA